MHSSCEVQRFGFGVAVFEFFVEGFSDDGGLDAFLAELGFDEASSRWFAPDDRACFHPGVLAVVEDPEFGESVDRVVDRFGVVAFALECSLEVLRGFGACAEHACSGEVCERAGEFGVELVFEVLGPRVADREVVFGFGGVGDASHEASVDADGDLVWLIGAGAEGGDLCGAVGWDLVWEGLARAVGRFRLWVGAGLVGAVREGHQSIVRYELISLMPFASLVRLAASRPVSSVAFASSMRSRASRERAWWKYA